MFTKNIVRKIYFQQQNTKKKITILTSKAIDYIMGFLSTHQKIKKKLYTISSQTTLQGLRKIFSKHIVYMLNIYRTYKFYYTCSPWTVKHKEKFNKHGNLSYKITQ